MLKFNNNEKNDDVSARFGTNIGHDKICRHGDVAIQLRRLLVSIN